jgi:methionyl-tRNA synthetase
MDASVEAPLTPPPSRKGGEEGGIFSFQEFQKLDLRVARVEAVEPHPKADRLYLLQVTDGSEVRTIVAGIRQAYSAEALRGRLVVVVWNLQPAVIRGVESRGMLLAADVEGCPALLGPDRGVPPGSRVR